MHNRFQRQMAVNGVMVEQAGKQFVERTVGAQHLAVACQAAAMAIGAELKKRVNRTSAARCSERPSSPAERLMMIVRDAGPMLTHPCWSGHDGKTGQAAPGRCFLAMIQDR